MKQTATTFFLGILFAQLPYDHAILFSPSPSSPTSTSSSSSSSTSNKDPYTILELHLRQLHASPAIVPRILHIVISVGLLGFFIKLYKPSESNTLFDGASLFLYMCGLTVYIANIVKGLRVVSEGSYGLDVASPGGSGGGVGATGGAAGAAAGGVVGGGAGAAKTVAEGIVGREDSLRVLSASNTILALILVGVLGLQAGQWYAERKDEQEEMMTESQSRRSHAEKTGSLRKGSVMSGGKNGSRGGGVSAGGGGDGNEEWEEEEEDDDDEQENEEVSLVGTATGGDIGGSGNGTDEGVTAGTTSTSGGGGGMNNRRGKKKQ